MKKKRFATLFMCLVLTLTISTVSLAKIPIRMATYGDGTTLATYNKIADVFNKSHPDFDLQIEVYPFSEYPAKIQVMLAGGNYPDVFLTWAQYKPAWVEQGLLLDVDAMWNNSQVAKSSRLYPFALEAATYQGRLYGVPHDFSAMVWCLNVDALNNTGLALPRTDWTVDEFQQYAKKLNRPGEMYGTKLAAGSSITSWQWTRNYIGEGWVSDDLTRVNVEDPKNIEMLQMWQDLIWTSEVAWASGKPTSKGDFDGGWAMWLAFAHYAARIESTNAYDFTFAPMPKGPAGQDSVAHGHMWSIPAMSTNPKLGWVVLEWVVSPEGQRAFVELNDRQPLAPNNELWNLYYRNITPERKNRIQKAVLDDVYGKNLIQTMNYWPTWPQVEQAMNEHLANIFTKRNSPANEMTIAAQKIRAIMGIK